MEKLTFAAVIPTRGKERTPFLNWQRVRAEQLGYDEIIVVDYEPISQEFDLYQRLAVGFSKAQAKQIDFVSIIEDDDFYDLKYLEHVKEAAHKTVDIIGFSSTTYYHLKSGGYRNMNHPGRSSLFATTIATKRFPSLIKVAPSNPYLDIAWWNQAHGSLAWRLMNSEPFLGIKHGLGKSGGNGHREAMYNTFDSRDRNVLRTKTDQAAFEFYRTMINELYGQKI